MVQMQIWTGNFSWNDQCNSGYCCCYAGQLSVINSDSNLVFTSDTKGCASSRTSLTFSNPNGYAFTTRGVRGTKISYKLSADSNTLTVQNDDYNYCTSAATRTSAAKHIDPSIISLVMMLLGIWILL